VVVTVSVISSVYTSRFRVASVISAPNVIGTVQCSVNASFDRVTCIYSASIFIIAVAVLREIAASSNKQRASIYGASYSIITIVVFRIVDTNTIGARVGSAGNIVITSNFNVSTSSIVSAGIDSAS
jgi:hypothetical protein